MWLQGVRCMQILLDKTMQEMINIFKEEGFVPSQNHILAINWLVNGDRQSGRSTALAAVFLTTAMANPNVWMRIFDHHPDRQANRNLMERIKGLYDKLDVPQDATLIFSDNAASPRMKIVQQNRKC